MSVIEKAAALTPVTVASGRTGHIGIDGLRNMIGDLRRGGITPKAIVLSKRDRLDVNDDIMAMSVSPVSQEDANRKLQIGYVDGVMIGWNRNVSNGKCVVIPAD